ncbi:cytochrome C class I protein [Alsobacter soli]|uniref:Cytochrome C class I protein n=1 Tax=Alsobacter soli TaxID=2109933 RepID=A0A2T1HNB5_9HYPH|nr:cytochrome c [Alsobacter soli]PSC03069.1 cytochrome C class I protein [Alsobacter soli]
MRFLALIGALAIVAAIGAAVYFFGGFYSVAAQYDDPAPVNWALVQARTRSIDRHAKDQPPGDLQSRVEAGGRAFATRGCPTCHGAPGVEWAKFSEGLNPSPPDLKDVAKDLEPQQIFWVVKNGIRMTGMPSFAGAGAPDDEIWSIAAFVKKLPEVKEEDYKSWTTAAAPAGQSAAETPAPKP